MRAITYSLLGLGLLMHSTHAFVKIWAGEECEVRYESTKSDGKKTWKEWSAPGPWAVLGEEGQRFEVIMKPKDNDSFGRTAEVRTCLVSHSFVPVIVATVAPADAENLAVLHRRPRSRHARGSENGL